jgi:hypothetical protein
MSVTEYCFEKVKYKSKSHHTIYFPKLQRINETLENKQYCSAAFLDISQALDKVWHNGLLYMLRRSLPLNYFLILKSYLHSRHFLVKAETEYTELYSVNAGFQLKALRTTLYAPWYVLNTVIRMDLQIPTVKEEIHRYNSQYSARLNAHPDDLLVNLMAQPDNSRRLRRHLPNYLLTRFLE